MVAGKVRLLPFLFTPCQINQTNLIPIVITAFIFEAARRTVFHLLYYFCQPMQKSLAISLLLVFAYSALVPVKVQEELRALPNLLAHYQEHLEKNPAITIVEFWELHYGKDYLQHQQDHDHTKLPGKEDHCCHVHVLDLVALPHVIDFELNPTASSGALLPSGDAAFACSHIRSIWQPPKPC